jgi:DNA polymerase III psi subunit
MGIQQWVLKSNPDANSAPELSESVDFTQQIQVKGEIGASLLMMSGPLDPKADQLLSVMLHSIGVVRTACYQLTVDSVSLFTEEPFAQYLNQQAERVRPKVVVQFGGERSSIAGLYWIDHPADLISYPERKRAAWNTLKQLHVQLSQT